MGYRHQQQQIHVHNRKQAQVGRVAERVCPTPRVCGGGTCHAHKYKNHWEGARHGGMACRKAGKKGAQQGMAEPINKIHSNKAGWAPMGNPTGIEGTQLGNQRTE